MDAMLDIQRAVKQVLLWTFRPMVGFFLTNARCAGAFAWVVIYWIILWHIEPIVNQYFGTIIKSHFHLLYMGLASGLLILSGIVALSAAEKRKGTESSIKAQARAIADALVSRDSIVNLRDYVSEENSTVGFVIREARAVEFGQHRDPEALCNLLRKLRAEEPARMTTPVEVALSGLINARDREIYGPTDLGFTWTAMLFAFMFTVLCAIFSSTSDNFTFALGAFLATVFAVNNCFLLIDERYI